MINLDSSDQAVKIGEIVVCIGAMMDKEEEVRVRGIVGDADLLEDVDLL